MRPPTLANVMTGPAWCLHGPAGHASSWCSQWAGRSSCAVTTLQQSKPLTWRNISCQSESPFPRFQKQDVVGSETRRSAGGSAAGQCMAARETRWPLVTPSARLSSTGNASALPRRPHARQALGLSCGEAQQAWAAGLQQCKWPPRQTAAAHPKTTGRRHGRGVTTWQNSIAAASAARAAQ